MKEKCTHTFEKTGRPHWYYCTKCDKRIKIRNWLLDLAVWPLAIIIALITDEISCNLLVRRFFASQQAAWWQVYVPAMAITVIVFILAVLLLSRIAYRFLPICIDQKEE